MGISNAVEPRYIHAQDNRLRNNMSGDRDVRGDACERDSSQLFSRMGVGARLDLVRGNCLHCLLDLIRYIRSESVLNTRFTIRGVIWEYKGKSQIGCRLVRVWKAKR
jgi:hypothetical protein